MYNQSFIEEVKRVYVGCANIIACAERGDYILGRYLDDSCGSISADEVLNLSPIDLQKKAENMKARQNLYKKWSSGECYTDESLSETMCPMLYLQNSNCAWGKKSEIEKILCQGVGYVGYFPGCKKWECRKSCWDKYNEIKDSI